MSAVHKADLARALVSRLPAALADRLTRRARGVLGLCEEVVLVTWADDPQLFETAGDRDLPPVRAALELAARALLRDALEGSIDPLPPWRPSPAMARALAESVFDPGQPATLLRALARVSDTWLARTALSDGRRAVGRPDPALVVISGPQAGTATRFDPQRAVSVARGDAGGDGWLCFSDRTVGRRQDGHPPLAVCLRAGTVSLNLRAGTILVGDPGVGDGHQLRAPTKGTFSLTGSGLTFRLGSTWLRVVPARAGASEETTFDETLATDAPLGAGLGLHSTPMNKTLVDDLRADLASGDVVCIVGTGVSVAATGNSLASWAGLLKSGVDECEKVAQPLPKGWADRVREELESGDLDELLSAAEKISRRLDAPTGGNFGRWLRERIGTLKVTDPRVPEALRELGAPLMTTNYDDVLRQVTGLDPITWRDGAEVERVLRGYDRAIVHLHGHWRRPDSVVLGIRSYADLLANPTAQALQQALRSMKTLLFVGSKDGLADPNFGALLQWSGEAFARSQFRHYLLARASEAADIQKAHPRERQLYVIPYGTDFTDLAPFLRSIAPTTARRPPHH